jgi:hypothetical protein
VEGLFAFFGIGTWSFFIMSAVFTFFLFYCVEHEFSVRSGLVIIAYIGFLQLISKANIIDTVANNRIKFLIGILGYLVIGFIWSTIKWWLFVNKGALDYKKKRLSFLERCAQKEQLRGQHDNILSGLSLDTEVPERLMEDWRREIGFGFKFPKVSNNKDKIFIWVIYWPISFIWSLLNDFIKKTIDIIIIKIRFVYDRITKSAFNNVKEF